mgnify:FL=1
MPTTKNFGWFLLGAAVIIGGAVGWQMKRRRSTVEAESEDEALADAAPSAV